MRPSGRTPEAMRAVILEPGVAKYAEGSCLARFGDTHVLCMATVEERVPPFLRNTGRGWVTAEYGMLPRSTHTRTDREAARGWRSAPGPARRPHAGDPAADRTQPAGGDRSCCARRAAGPHRLRCIAGGWRDPHGRDYRQLCRAASGIGEICRGGAADCPAPQ